MKKCYDNPSNECKLQETRNEKLRRRKHNKIARKSRQRNRRK